MFVCSLRPPAMEASTPSYGGFDCGFPSWTAGVGPDTFNKKRSERSEGWASVLNLDLPKVPSNIPSILSRTPI